MSNLYSDTDLKELPVAAVLASRGCGNPTALAELHVGKRVLDLGCGGSINVLLSAHLYHAEVVPFFAEVVP